MTVWAVPDRDSRSGWLKFSSPVSEKAGMPDSTLKPVTRNEIDQFCARLVKTAAKMQAANNAGRAEDRGLDDSEIYERLSFMLWDVFDIHDSATNLVVRFQESR